MPTPRHQIPHVLPSQAQKHVTVNTALGRIDTILQLAVTSRASAAPPAGPATGDAHIVGAGATGDWAGHDDEIAVWDGAGWAFTPPKDGLIAHVADDDTVCRYLSGWAALPAADTAAQFGINGTADSYNRLLVQSTGVLLNHAGSHQRTTINKSAATDDATVLFQTGFSSRALTGLLGDDDYTVKVSPNGSSFTEAIRVDKDTAVTALPHGVRSGAHAGLGDDSSIAIPVAPARGGSGLILVFCQGGGVHAAVWYDIGATPATGALGTSGPVALTTGALNGTTGADGDLTIAAVTGAIHIENRLGGAQDIRWFFVN